MSIKAESIKAALAAYEIERDCIDKMRDYFNSIDDEERAEIIKIVKAETAREYRETIKGDVYAWAYIISNMSK